MRVAATDPPANAFVALSLISVNAFEPSTLRKPKLTPLVVLPEVSRYMTAVRTLSSNGTALAKLTAVNEEAVPLISGALDADLVTQFPAVQALSSVLPAPK